jgi:ABC-type multidrug transport system, ATPase component
MNKIIEVDHLSKSYGNVKAVKEIDFYVEQGKLFAFLGPNGAGKSTTIDMICTFLKPDGGIVTVDGHTLGKDDDKIRSVIGAVFQEGLLDPLLTIYDNLKTRGGFYGLKGENLQKAIKKTAEFTGIGDLLKRPYGKLSGGQRRRCDIARALIHTPKILFLDEPTTGLDPQTRKNIWQTIQSLQQNSGMTVFLTTHYMEEAAEADYVIVIDNGEIVAKGTPTQLKEQYASDKLKLVCKDTERVCFILEDANVAYKRVQNILTVKLETTLDSLHIIELCKADIAGFEVLNGTMDDAFIEITGKEIRE